MNGKERILKALAIQQPDRVPLYIHGINEAPIIGIGRHLTDGLPAPRQFHEMTDGEKMKLVDTLFLIHEAFGVDGITTFEIGHESELDDKHVMDDWGITYRRSPHGLPVAKGHPVKDAADLDRYAAPEPDRAHLLLLDLARDRFKGNAALFWLMRGVFVRSWRLMGMENYMIKLYQDPLLVERVAEMVTRYNLKQLDMLADAGLDVLVVEDDIANTKALLISPAHFRRYVNPYNRRLVDRAHALGVRVVRHSDGNLWPILDTLIASGYDGLNPLEPQAGMDLGKVKDACGDRICLLGNIDCMHLLPEGTPAEVDAAVRQAIDAAAAGGGYILCSSNSLHPGVNPENCIAMFQAAKTYGRYE
ncbi:uroporphyrinogen decarboxylase family protein [uncultured Desulfosarcina sp.]|uniref:uroporphyrinogen decarboxylase family protein n=1 Tax=uncultured Desulfosarcina sp. TaxID=218289 RepID=UPI0029C7FB42|nr:uroporphyrinogen decarboxylase family protein [uncultured Desulfosarcina sp.]